MELPEDMRATGEWLMTLGEGELRDLLLEGAREVPQFGDWLEGRRALDADDPAELLGVVNASLTPRKRFYHYREANEYASDARWAVALLVERSHSGSAGLCKVIERAITLTTRAILRSDDSSGLQGDLVRDLLEAHARCVRTATPALTQGEQTRLVTWLIKYRYGGTQDFFDPDIVAYAPALSERSIERYRGMINAVELGPYGSYPLTRLAVLDRDRDAIIAAHGDGLANSRIAARIVTDLEEAGLHADAVEYAYEALPGEGGFFFDLVDFLTEDALSGGDGGKAVALRRGRFEKNPSSTAFDRLRRTATTAGLWERERPDAEHRLAERDPAGYITYLLGEDRVEEAWTRAAGEISPAADEHTWLALCERRAATHPGQTLPIYEEIVREILTTTDKRNYRWAAKVLTQMRAAAQSAGEEARFAAFLAAVREENRRRPTCIAVFDRAGLT